MRRPRRVHHGTILAQQAWLRCGRALVMLGAFTLSAGVLQSTLSLHEQNQALALAVADKEARVEQLEREHRHLAETKAFLQTCTGTLAASRALGWLRPGERRVMFDEQVQPGGPGVE